MSFESLVATQPPVKVMRQARPGEVDENGLPTQRLVKDRNSTGRLVMNSGQQKEMWNALGIESDYTFVTQDESIQNGEFIELGSYDGGTGRRWRVNGLNRLTYPIGNLPRHCTYGLQEVATTGLPSTQC